MVDFLRSPFSRSRPGQPERDVFNSIRMDETLAKVMNELLDRNELEPDVIEDFFVGCALGVDENWTYGGRSPIFLANWPVDIPGQMVDRQCASSSATQRLAALEIMTGNRDVVMATGMEHMTHIPMQPQYQKEGMISWSTKFFEDPKYDRYEMEISSSMGLTAEKLFSEEPEITKEDMDRWSLRSHKKAAEALEEGYFEGEILPIEAEQSDGSMEVIEEDQAIRPDTSYEKIKGLPPAFKEDGVITPGNSSPLNAGASAVLLMSREKANELGLEPMASFVSLGWSAVHPSVMGRGPVPASKEALEKTDLEVDDIDAWEINEAFAVVTLNTINKLGIEPERVNKKGGAIAIGHPLGATGARLSGTLARILIKEDLEYGISTPCVGGGQGEAILIKNEQ